LVRTDAPRAYDIFTDGSTPMEGDRNSGYAAVILDKHKPLSAPVVLCSWLKASGNNFLAELAGLLAVPAQADVCVYTDSMACIQAVQRGDLAERKRIRAAARPMLTSLRRVVDARTGSLEFRYVRSHTTAATYEAAGNRIADEQANAGRAMGEDKRGGPYLFNEERVIAEALAERMASNGGPT